jgi:hypothetical protein
MKINDIIDNNYKYKIISDTKFSNKYLMCNSDESKYKKYILVCYKEGDIIKYEDVPDESYLDRFTNIINPIVSTIFIYQLSKIFRTITIYHVSVNQRFTPITLRILYENKP